jgi:hypothetical protein
LEETSFSELLCLYLAAGIALLGLAFGGYSKTAARRNARPWRDGDPGPWTHGPKPPEFGSTLVSLENELVNGARELSAEEGRFSHRPTSPARLGKKTVKRGLRRKGEVTPVQVCAMDPDAQPFDATVSDRSNGGLGLCLPESVSIGTVLRVRSSQYEDHGPWVEVEVKHCRRENDQWIAGCKFKESLPLNVLLLFG